MHSPLRSLRFRVILAGTLMIGFAVAIGLADSFVSSRLDAAVTAAQLGAVQNELAASQLLVDLVDMETGLRGYLVTRDPRFLTPYEQGNNDRATETSALEDATGAAGAGRAAVAAEQAWVNGFAVPT